MPNGHDGLIDSVMAVLNPPTTRAVAAGRSAARVGEVAQIEAVQSKYPFDRVSPPAPGSSFFVPSTVASARAVASAVSLRRQSSNEDFVVRQEADGVRVYRLK